MKPTLKNTLMTLTVLSTGLFLLSSGNVSAGYQRPKARQTAPKDDSFAQYPKLGELRDEVNMALNLHQTAVSLLADREQLQKYKDSIEKYDEIVRRLKKNTRCNIDSLNNNYVNGKDVWSKIAAYAEDASSKLLAEASNSLGEDAEASNELGNLEKGMDSKNFSSGEEADRDEDDIEKSASSVGNGSDEITDIQAIKKQGEKERDADENANKAEAESDAAQKKAEENGEMDLGEAAAFGKIRWDVGFAILKDIYASPREWGTMKSNRFSPWVDQKHIYDVYLNEYYDEIEKKFSFVRDKEKKGCGSLPDRPTMSKNDSYLPEDYYSGSAPYPKDEKSDVKNPYMSVSNVVYTGQTADERWCGQTGGKRNICTRVNKGELKKKHDAYVAKLNACVLTEEAVNATLNMVQFAGASFPFKSFKEVTEKVVSLFRRASVPTEKEENGVVKFEGGFSLNIEPPYLPQVPLPPFKESVYIANVKKQIPEIASELPDPWYKVTRNIKNFTDKGELATLVKKDGNTVKYHNVYDKKTLEIETDSKGNPKIPIPLMSNRISSYLSLLAAKEQQKPIRDRAEASIKEMNESIIAVFEKAGHIMSDGEKASFDLTKEEDYNKAVKTMKSLQNLKIGNAKLKMEELKASFGGKLLPSVQAILDEESRTMAAMQTDSLCLINVTRDNAASINSLLETAAADGMANEYYKADVAEKMKESEDIPPIGCPVL